VIDRIYVFTGGGLLSIVQIKNNEARVLTNWPEEVSLSAMSVVAYMLKEYQETKNRVVIHKDWIAYIPEESNFIPMVKISNKRYLLATIGFIRRLSLKLKDLPEECRTVAEAIISIYEKHFKQKISKIIMI